MEDEIVNLLNEDGYEFHTRMNGSSGHCWHIGSLRTGLDYGRRHARIFRAISKHPGGLREINFIFSITGTALACGWVQELIGDEEKYLLEGGLVNFSQLLKSDDSIGEYQEMKLHSRLPKEEFIISTDDILEAEIERVRQKVLTVLKQNAYKGIERTGKDYLVKKVCTSDVLLDRTLVFLGENGFLKGALSDQIKITPAGENELKNLEVSIQTQTMESQKPILSETGKKYDVFISHASEDKDSFVRELAQALVKNGISVWYDEFTLKLGSSLRAEIDKGLANSAYGIVVLSHSFFSKDWPKLELEGLFALMKPGDGKLLPIWHEITREELAKYSPMISGILAAKSSEGLNVVVSKILEVTKGIELDRNIESDSVANLFVQLFKSHGVHRNQIPRFFGYGLTIADVKGEETLTHKLTEEILDAACDKFAIRREWLDGAESQIHTCHNFYKKPKEFLNFIRGLITNNADGEITGVIIAPEENDEDANAIIILQESIGYIGDKVIYRYHLCNNWAFTYWKARAYLTACVAIAWSHQAYTYGITKPKEFISELAYGEVLLASRFEGIGELGNKDWDPEDMTLDPESYLYRVDPEKNNYGIRSGLKLWLRLEEQGLMDSEIGKSTRQLFEKELEKYSR